MPMRLKAHFTLAALFLGSFLSFAQDQAKTTPTSKRSTVGLVLQGGGALGLAHVGVITWLEEHHIPVDYVAGTSMGGLVGGVYATGHNAAEMRQIVNGIPWDEVLSQTTAFDDLSFRR
jgi:NTE family protein